MSRGKRLKLDTGNYDSLLLSLHFAGSTWTEITSVSHGSSTVCSSLPAARIIEDVCAERRCYPVCVRIVEEKYTRGEYRLPSGWIPSSLTLSSTRDRSCFHVFMHHRIRVSEIIRAASKFRLGVYVIRLSNVFIVYRYPCYRYHRM